jgi:IS1 family transposase
MNRLTKEDRAKILTLLCEGMSIRAVTRVTGASKNTVAKLLLDAGRAASAYQDRVLRNLQCKRVQVDEIWSFVYAKRNNVASAKSAPKDAGDVWTWTAIDADTKLLINFFVGARDTEAALHFMNDLSERVPERFQLTSDQFAPYRESVNTIFADQVDYAMLKKIYGPALEGARRYSPPVCLGAKKRKVIGNPDRKHISTSYVERANLTMRMHMRRFTRLTNAFSKKVENHAAAISLHSMFYNFVRLHQTLGVSPAMAAGVTDRLWEMSDVVEVIEAWERKEKREHEPTFEAIEWKIGGGAYVKVTFPNEAPVNVEGFATKNDALIWIRHESKIWLSERRANPQVSQQA